MPAANQIIFTYQELAEMMVRKLGISEGLWGIYVKFGIAAANAGPSSEELKPTAIVPVLEIGIQRMEEPSNLTVDAAEMTKPSATKSKRTRVAAKR